jgi:hypothetical protein
MLCLDAWFGNRWFGDFVRDQQIKVWAKIGGKFLGFLERPCAANKAQTKQDVVSALCSLQAKVATWLPHPQRGPKHLLVFDGLIQLTPTEFAYNTQSLDAQVVARHLGAAKDLYVLWNEDDSYAERVLDKQNLSANVDEGYFKFESYFGDEAYATFSTDRPEFFFAELEAYNWKGKPIERARMRFRAFRLGNAAMFPVLRRMTLDYMDALQDEDCDALAQCKLLETLEVTLVCGLSPRISLLKGLTTLKLLVRHGPTTIPSEIGSLGNLTSLELQGHGFQGCIPPELGQLSKLKHLAITWTMCSSCIPCEFGNLKHLETLDLTNNQHLYGSLPSTLSKLYFLKDLHLRCSLNVRTYGCTMGRGFWKGMTWTSE